MKRMGCASANFVGSGDTGGKIFSTKKSRERKEVMISNEIKNGNEIRVRKEIRARKKFRARNKEIKIKT